MNKTDSTVHTKLEFVVDINQDVQVEKLRNILSHREEIQNVDIDLLNKRLIMDTSLQASKVQKIIEESLETDAVLLGAGKPLGAAVSALYSNMNQPFERRVHGLVRFMQADDERCVIDGTIDGLPPKSRVRINIHQYGDLSNGCDSCGDYYDFKSFTKIERSERPIGMLDEVETDDNGSTSFRLLNQAIKVPDIIGRSFVVQTLDSKRVACGIIARSAGTFENAKRICTCSGTTLWQERREAKERFQ